MFRPGIEVGGEKGTERWVLRKSDVTIVRISMITRAEYIICSPVCKSSEEDDALQPEMTPGTFMTWATLRFRINSDLVEEAFSSFRALAVGGVRAMRAKAKNKSRNGILIASCMCGGVGFGVVTCQIVTG